MPSLQHCASVKIAVRLLEEFGVQILQAAYTEIQQGKLSTSEINCTKSCQAKYNLLDIPLHLRQSVMEAVHGSHQAVLAWECYHEKFKEDKSSLRWRTDGSIDVVKTAQNLVENEKFSLRDRLDLASGYLLKDIALALIKKMHQSAETENLKRTHEIFLETNMQRFPRVFETPSALFPRCSNLLPKLPLDQRENYFELLDFISSDDQRFFLYALTKDEEEKILLADGAYNFLSLHLMWPLQTLFQDTAAKLWDYVDTNCFSALLSDMFYFKDNWMDFNYSQLLDWFWNESPLDFKESTRDQPELRHRIDSFLDEKEEKRKFIDNRSQAL